MINTDILTELSYYVLNIKNISSVSSQNLHYPKQNNTSCEIPGYIFSNTLQYQKPDKNINKGVNQFNCEIYL